MQQLQQAPTIPPLVDDTMETENKILLIVFLDLIELSLEPRIVEQTHNYYFQAIVAASLQHQLDLS